MNKIEPFSPSKIPFRDVETPEDQALLKKSKSIPFRDVEIPEERSLLSQASRLGGQFALGLGEQALLPYEAAVAPFASPEAQMASYRETLFEDLDRLQQQKGMGQWDEQDQKLYESIIEQIKNPELSKPFVVVRIFSKS